MDISPLRKEKDANGQDGGVARDGAHHERVDDEEPPALTPVERTFTCNGPRDGDGSAKHASLVADRGVSGRLSACDTRRCA